ncbi:MAG: YbhN family protein [Candidatus Coproplasma sp.]
MSIDEELKLNTAPQEREPGGDIVEGENVEVQPMEKAESTAVEDEKPQPTQEQDGAEDVTAPSEAVTQKTAKPKRKISKIIMNVVLAALIVFGIFSLFGIVNYIKPGEGASFVEVFSNASPWFMLLLVVVILGIMSLDCAKYCIIDKTVTGKVRLSTSVKTSFLGKYYDAVTPFSTGGQPMQIYYLNSKGISGGNSTAIVLIRYFSSILSWVTLGAALMIAGTVKNVLGDVTGKTLLLITGWVGIGVNLILPMFIAFFLIFPKIMYKLTWGVVRLGKKVKIVKDEQRALCKATKVVDDFKHSFKVMATSPLKLIMLMIVSYGEAFLTFSVPFFVMKAFNCNVEGQLITVMSLNAFATFGVSFIPTPGNSGVMEGFAALAFSAAAGPTLAWSVLVWRLLVYYIYILVGLIVTIRDIIKRNIVKRRDKKKQDKLID